MIAGAVPETKYDPQRLMALGALIVEFSALEASAKRLAGHLVSPHHEFAQIVASDYSFAACLDNLRTFVINRLEPGALSSAINQWIGLADAARIERNRYVHGHWLPDGPLMLQQVKKHELTTTILDVTAQELLQLAERAWELAQEGHHLYFDLGCAGLSTVTYVSSTESGGVVSDVRPASTEYRMKDHPLLARPPIQGMWPGRVPDAEG